MTHNEAEGASLIPPTPDSEAYWSVFGDEAVWLSAAAEVCRREGLDPGGPGRKARLSHYPVVMLPSGLVVKFFGPVEGGERAWASERRGLELLARDPELPIPKIVADADLDEEWSYIVMTTLSGSLLREAAKSMATGGFVAVGRWLGRFVARLRSLDLSPEERAAGRDAYLPQTRWRHANVVRLLSDRDILTPELREQIPAWLPPVDDLIGDPAAAVPVHGELNAHHVLGRANGDGFEPTGIIDFNTFRIGETAQEIGMVWQGALGLDRPSFIAFLVEAGIDRHAPDFPTRTLASVMMQTPPTLRHIADLEAVSGLDELAARAFGFEGEPLRVQQHG